MVRIEVTHDGRPSTILEIDVTPLLAARFFGWQIQMSQMTTAKASIPDITEEQYAFGRDFLRRAGIAPAVIDSLQVNAVIQIPTVAIEQSGVPAAVLGKSKVQPLPWPAQDTTAPPAPTT